MRKIIFGLVALLLVGGAGWWWLRSSFDWWFFSPTPAATDAGVTLNDLPTVFSSSSPQHTDDHDSVESAVEIVAKDLTIPWELTWLPDQSLLVTERPGRLLKIALDRTVIPISGVAHVGEGGLQGLAVHPQFTENSWIYLYLTTRAEHGLINRVERYRLEGTSLHDRVIILDNIPGAQFHDGGRIAFGPASADLPAGQAGATAGKSDYYLYVTTGDAGQEPLAQDTSSLAGKILRVHDDGSIPADNPFGNAVYSYGHRNSQGLAWDSAGQLWATEHGRSGARSGFDELNLIERGGNYGWPQIEGDQTASGMIPPVIHSGANETWAPAGAAMLDDQLFFTGLRGESLYEVTLEGEGADSLTAHFRGEFGRLRAVQIGPDGWLYVMTSNQDGRGTVRTGDDQIIRINPVVFQ